MNDYITPSQRTGRPRIGVVLLAIILFDWLFDQINPLACVLFAVVVVLTFFLGSAHVHLKALIAFCGG